MVDVQYCKLPEKARELIRQLWLRHGSQWERIRREAEQQDGAVLSWLAGRTKTQAQVRGRGGRS